MGSDDSAQVVMSQQYAVMSQQLAGISKHQAGMSPQLARMSQQQAGMSQQWGNDVLLCWIHSATVYNAGTCKSATGHESARGSQSETSSEELARWHP